MLLGDPVPYTLTASNPAGNAPLYNVSFSDVLPAGFEYVGPTDPASAGEPTVTTTPGGQTLLVWNNVTDLQAASVVHPEVRGQTEGAGSHHDRAGRQEHRLRRGIDQRAQGAEVHQQWHAGRRSPEVVSNSDTTDTKRAPFVVEKKNTNSPEGELLRGVHNQRSTSTRSRSATTSAWRRTTSRSPTTCRRSWSSSAAATRTTPPGREYPGVRPLGSPASTPTRARDPVSVETVKNPQDVPGLGDLTGVYTAVTWNVGNLAAGEVKRDQVRRGHPAVKRTRLTWDPGPDADRGQSLEQGSNLDNNNGALHPGGHRRAVDHQPGLRHRRLHRDGSHPAPRRTRLRRGHRGTHGDHRGRPDAEVRLARRSSRPAALPCSPWTSKSASTWTPRTSSSPTRCPTGTARWGPLARPPGPPNRPAPRRQATRSRVRATPTSLHGTTSPRPTA